MAADLRRPGRKSRDALGARNSGPTDGILGWSANVMHRWIIGAYLRLAAQQLVKYGACSSMPNYGRPVWLEADVGRTCHGTDI